MRTLALPIFGILVPLALAPVQDGQEPEYVYPKETSGDEAKGLLKAKESIVRTTAARGRTPFLLLIIVLGALATPAALSQQKNPLAGTWHANISKSQRHPNHLFKSATLRFEVTDELVSFTYSGVNMSGVEESGTFKIHPDGKEHPIPDAPGLVEVSRWTGPRLLDTVASQYGKVVGHSSYEISEDGKTLTAKISGTDAGGAEFEQVIVCDRE